MKRALRILLNAILLIFSISCIFPIVWVFYSSFKTQAEFSMSSLGFPQVWTFQNYISVATQTNMWNYIWNSARVSVISVTLIIVFSFVMGYFFSRFKFFGRNVLFTYVMMGMLLPIHALLVPAYIQIKTIGWNNQWWTLILPYVAFGMPIATVLTESFVATIPRTFEEAAAIDGCSFTKTLFEIILPLTLPILATIAIIQFFYCWNEFSFSLVLLSSEELRTIPVGLTTFKSMYTVDYPRLMAGIMVSVMPVMVLYFIFSDRIIKGMTAGAIKG